MLRISALVCVLLPLVGCLATAIPPDYKGPIAHVYDTSVPRSDMSFDLFYVAKVNERQIDNSHEATIRANYGPRLKSPKVITRDIPAEPSKIRIVGRTHHATPLNTLFGKVYEVSGEIEFIPEADAYYFVRGVLNDDYSAVWLENASGMLIGHKIEVKGSTAVGLFEK